MWHGMIEQYIKNMSPQDLQKLAANQAGIQLSSQDAETLLHLVKHENVNLADQESILSFIAKVEKATSKEHAMLLYSLYQQYGHRL